MSTIKDVAREAGVSIGTVSAILNGSTTIKAKNRARVYAAIEKLHYQPNLVARTLKTGASKSIGLLIPDITNPFYPELARGVEDAARKEGMTVFLCNNDRDVEKERDYVAALLSKTVDGIIMVKPQMPCDELRSLALRCNLVLVDPSSSPSDSYDEFDVIRVDDKNGARKAVEHLIEFGHRKIAYISGRMESISALERFEAYKEVLAENKITFTKEYVRNMNYDWYSGYTATLDLLKLIDPPTAIFAANDIIAFGVLKALRERNISVPLEMSVIGFDDIAQSSYSAPPLTTVRQPKYEVGAMSVNVLIRRIRDEGPKERCSAFFDTDFIVRETVNYASTAIKSLVFK